MQTFRDCLHKIFQISSNFDDFSEKDQNWGKWDIVPVHENFKYDEKASCKLLGNFHTVSERN